MTDERADRAPGRVRRAATATRGAIRRRPAADRAYRIGVGVVGGTTTALGVVLIPLPGPGALVVLGGLAMLATEFDGAKRMSRRANDAARTAASRVADRRADRRARREWREAEREYEAARG